MINYYHDTTLFHEALLYLELLCAMISKRPL